MRSDALVCGPSQDRAWRLGSECSGGYLFKEIRAATMTYSTSLCIVFHCDDEGKTCRAAERLLDVWTDVRGQYFNRKVTLSELEIAFSWMTKCPTPTSAPFTQLCLHFASRATGTWIYLMLCPTAGATRWPFRCIFPYRRNVIRVTNVISSANLPVI